MGAAYERADEVARQLKSSAELAPSLVGLCSFHMNRGEFAKGEEISAELFRIARELGDSEVLLQAHHSAWPNRFLRGMPAKACKHIDGGLTHYDERRYERHRYLYLNHDPAVCALGFGGIVQWLMGHPKRAICLEREAIELARRLRHAPSLAHALWLIGESQVARRDVAGVITTAPELLALCEEDPRFGMDLLRCTATALAIRLHATRLQMAEGRLPAGQPPGSPAGRRASHH